MAGYASGRSTLGFLAAWVVAAGCSTRGPYPPELDDDPSAGRTATKGVTSAGPGDAASITADGAISSDAAPVGLAAPEAGACVLPACAPGGPCPDLVVDPYDLAASLVIGTRTFAPTDCAVTEACVDAPGTRRLLRFNTTTANLGTADLVVGSPTEGPASVCFQYSPCHMHYHFAEFSRYTLLTADGTTVAARGHKQSFCLEDSQPYPERPAPKPAERFTCTNQGLHVGWEDVYPNDIDCQWIDISGVPPGHYLLEVAINTEGLLPESDLTNDTATVPVTIP